MSTQIVAVTRRAAAALSRRASLMTLGGAATGVVARCPASIQAGGPGKAANKRAKRKCRAQGGQCRAAVAQLCETNNLDCDRVLPCCDFFARCQAPEGLRCIFEDPPAAPEL
jgi:hypothetical protein